MLIPAGHRFESEQQSVLISLFGVGDDPSSAAEAHVTSVSGMGDAGELLGSLWVILILPCLKY